jgi:prephenate dehydratase
MSMAVPTLNALSSGEAARLVAESNEYANCAALGPKSASKKYCLQVLNDAFEDKEAITTFFLIAPNAHQALVGKDNCVLIVFKVPHKPGALVKSLQPFDQEGLNLIQIHSVHAGNRTYNFAIEIEVRENEQKALDRAMEKFENCVDEYLSFGPFQVLLR